MSTLEQWLLDQSATGRRFYLVLDSLGQLDERNTLVQELETQRYRNLYIGTPAESLAKNGPYLFELDSFDLPALQALLASPERNWGWLASAENTDLDALSAHWRERLVTGERPDQAVYRFHDNRVFARALAYLQPEQRPEYLGSMASVCYWQVEQWMVTDNPAPGQYPLPTDPAWCHTPTPKGTFKSVQLDNTRRYLVREHTDNLLHLAQRQDIDTWLRGQFDLAYTWGWQEPDSIHFLLTQSLLAPNYAPPKTWLPQSNETPTMHFDRVYQETLYWQGDALV
jgi:hypothetical protein